MIPSNAALAGEYWERLLVLRLEQRRVAGREPPLAQPSEGQPGYSGELRVPLHPPGTYFGYPAYGYPAYGYPAYGYPGYPQPSYGYSGYSGYPAYSGPPS